jgi:hypothetical protein
MVITFKKYLIEINAAGAGGVFGVGQGGDSINSGDTYAPGDARIPKVLGTYNRKGKVVKRKNTKK